MIVKMVYLQNLDDYVARNFLDDEKINAYKQFL